MTETSSNNLDHDNHSSDIKWFALASEASEEFHEEYLDALAYAPRKVDILIRADDTPGVVQGDLLERLAAHPKVGTLIIFGVQRAQRILIAARAVMLGIHIRFCDTEDEVRVLVNKRRSRIILDSMPGKRLVLDHDITNRRNMH